MTLTRRSFLKSMAATLSISHVPSLLARSNLGPEPEWTVEEFDWGSQIGVAAQWIVGGKKIRHAYGFNLLNIGDQQKELMVAYAKQALRQWYLEKHLKIRSAA